MVIDRWLLAQPGILVLNEPTHRIDVGAKFKIYQLIAELVRKDKGIIITSSGIPGLLGIADRVPVMNNGLVAEIVDIEIIVQSEIFRLALSHL